MLYIGTSHFVSFCAAHRYYGSVGLVEKKIVDGSISIALPELKDNQTLRADRDGRFIICEEETK